MFPVTERGWGNRREAAICLMTALESTTTPEWTDDLASAISGMSGVFGSISRQSARDWFVMSGLLSHPSPRLSGRIAAGLTKLLTELEEDHIAGINTALDRLEASFLPQILERYVAATRPTGPTPVKPPSGWVFMLFPEAEPLMILAGTTKGVLGDVVDETRRANPGLSAFGVVAAWRVTDPDAAAGVLSDEIGYRAVANGYHSFGSRKDLIEAKMDLDRALTGRKLVVGNPLWEPTTPKPLMEIDPYSHDISNKQFKVDLEGVFDAFRR